MIGFIIGVIVGIYIFSAFCVGVWFLAHMVRLLKQELMDLWYQ